MQIQKSVRYSLVFAVLLFALALTPARRASAADGEMDVDVVADSVRFRPAIAYSEVRVTVRGPQGFEAQRSFSAADSLQIALPGHDGLYRYELRFSPELSRRERQRLATARAEGTWIASADPGGTDEQMVQRGWFRLADGAPVSRDGDEVEPEIAQPALAVSLDSSEATRATVLTTASGVIRSSLCVGFDCLNSPAFGDSTIILKENNTRIKFADTSTAGSYPRRDWEIQANSNLNGGGSYLGFNDCGNNDDDGGCAEDLLFAVEGGAPAYSLFVDDGGRVGLGTSIPVVDIHVVSGNTPTLRLEQDGSSGFQPQSWDVAGNETNFFVRDVTNGSTLPLRIRPGASTSAIDIDDEDNVGLSTSNPQQALHVQRTGGVNTAIRIDNDDTNAPDGWDLRVNTNGNFQITLVDSGAQEFQVATNGNATFSGNIVSGGGGTCDPGPCDGVFRPGGYELESIEEHAAYMWENQHLWGVGPTPEGQPLNLSKKTTGILHELEKAHIYIEQLHGELQELRQRLSTVEAQLAGGETVD